MNTTPSLSLINAPTRQAALQAFFAILDRHADRIARTQARVEAIYRFATPDRPVVDYDVTGFTGAGSPWAQSAQDSLLNWQLQHIVYRLESLPEADYVPCLHVGALGSEFIASLFGAEFDITPEGGAVPKAYLVRDLADIDRLPAIDIRETPQGRQVLENTRYLYEMTAGRVNIVYPQMQGPLSNTVRLMEQMDVLMACADEPEAMACFATKVWQPAVQLMCAMRAIVGGDTGVIRPRARFYQPSWVQGLIVDDYISVIGPEQFLAVSADAFRLTADEVGPLFLHTCGPVWQSVPALTALPGLVGFETVFLRGQTKTTAELLAMKRQLHGKVVMNSVQLPHGETVHDEENLTAAWLHEMTDDGGFMLHTGGSPEEGRRLLNRLEIY